MLRGDIAILNGFDLEMVFAFMLGFRQTRLGLDPGSEFILMHESFASGFGRVLDPHPYLVSYCAQNSKRTNKQTS